MIEHIINANPILMADGYKNCHWQQIPENVDYTYTVMVPRQIAPYATHIVAAGQSMIASYLASVRITEDMIDEAQIEIEQQGYEFNRQGWTIICRMMDGKLPLRIMGVEEGRIIPAQTPMMGWVNTQPGFSWLCGHVETVVQSIGWKMTTVASICRKIREIITDYSEQTGAVSGIDYMLHNFGDRGADSPEAAIIAGISHAMLFDGSDCTQANRYIKKLYNTAKSYTSSIIASEHFTMTSNADCANKDDYNAAVMMVEQLEKSVERSKNGIGIPFVSAVIDTYDDERFVCEYFGDRLKDRIINSGGRMVMRPDCYDDKTEILTSEGWKLFKDINDNTSVAEVLDDGSYKFCKPTKIISQHYTGNMIHFTDGKERLDLIVTPNHRMVINHNGKTIIEEAEHCKLYHAKGLIRSARVNKNSTTLSDLERLKIAFQADGSYKTKCDGIRFSFSKKRKITRLINLLNNLNINYKIYGLTDGRVEFNIQVNATEFSKNFDWVDLSSLSYDWCVDFIEELSYWDSCRRSPFRFKFDTTTKQVFDVVEIIAVSCGYGVLPSFYKDNRKSHFSDVYTLNIMKRNTLNGQSITKNIVPYDGMIYCVTVPSGKLLVKRNRGIVVCGNSGDPTTKPGQIGNILKDTFGYTTNDKGFNILHPAVGVIQGDGLTIDTIENVIKGWIDAGFSMDNFCMGMGSGITHDGRRDDFSFSVKAIANKLSNDQWVSLLKDPKTDSGKKSLSGLARCQEVDGELQIINNLTDLSGELFMWDDQPGWRKWFENGHREFRQSFDDVRARARG
jgi:nicotinic acid phosphoribosyltransferase